jgi:tetratricopeptide (TPR) repeat protein
VEAAFNAAQGYYVEAGVPHAGLTGADPLVGLGTFANARGMYAAAEQLGETARRQSEAAGDKGNLADAYYVLINAAYAQGHYETALHHAHQARALLEEIGDHWMRGYVLTTLGMITLALGDYRQAHGHFAALRKVREEFGDQEGTATALRLLADVAHLEGAHGDAVALYRHSLAILHRIYDRGGIAAALGGLAGAEWAEGRRADALAHYREALQIARAIGYMPLTLHLLAQLGACCYEAGDHDQGRTLLALSVHHNASGQEVKDQVARLLDCHQITLTPSDVAAALEQVQPDVFPIFLADLTGRLETLSPI